MPGLIPEACNQLCVETPTCIEFAAERGQGNCYLYDYEITEELVI